MRFFVHFHRSIVDRRFYIELAQDTQAHGGRYVALLIFLSVALTSAVDTIRALDPQSGLRPALRAMLQGMHIRDGILHPPLADPYALDPVAVARLWNVFAGISLADIGSFDSMVIVDTGAAKLPVNTPGVRVYLRKKTIEMRLGHSSAWVIAYKDIFPAGVAAFSAEELNSALRVLTPSLGVFFFFRDLVSTSWTAFFAVVLFSTATYILKTPRIIRLRGHVKVACFAVGPLVAGITLMALAKSRQTIMWYIFFLIALIIHVRGVDAAAKSLTSR